MSAWVKEGQEDQGQVIANVDKVFEDNFVTSDPENRQEKTFEKLNDSDDYLKLLESRLRKIKKDPTVLQQLKEKREECFNNLLNNSLSIRTEQDFEFEESVNSVEIIRHINPAQPQTVGEIAHLVKHDLLDQQKQEDEEENQEESEKK